MKEELLFQIDEMKIDWSRILCIFIIYSRNNRILSILPLNFSFGELRAEIFAREYYHVSWKPKPWLRSSPTGEVDGWRAARADTHNRVSRKNIIASSANRPSRSNVIRLCGVSARWYYIQDRFESHRINSCLLLLLRRVWSRSRAWISW